MSDETDKPSIPSWQVAAGAKQPVEPASISEPSTVADPKHDNTTKASDLAAAPETSPPAQSDSTNEQTQRDQVRSFLRNPAVRDEPIEKKRTFLQSQSLPAHLIDDELEKSTRTSATLDRTEFEMFKGRSEVAEQAKEAASESQDHSGAPPPIITYPEFLANAHQPPPLITPARILATTYIASATAVLAYAASAFLIRPMVTALIDARHDLATHSNSKVDELNRRLEKLVSEVPGPKKDKSEGHGGDAAGEPTELFSRSAGTQTELVAGSEASTSKVTIVEPTASTKQAENLTTLQKHLTDLMSGTEKESKAVEERDENVKKLRHYLDGLSYGSSGLNVWSNTGGKFGWEHEQQKEQDKKEDAIDELKREIRSVKGVLLSAKRFPAAGRGAGTPYSARRGVDAPA